MKKIVDFNRYPITLVFENYSKKVIPYSIYHGANNYSGNYCSSYWVLRGRCAESGITEYIKIDNILKWKLKHGLVPEGGGVRIDYDYRLLIRKSNKELYYTHIYHIPHLKYILNNVLEKDNEILFASECKLPYPPLD